MELATRSQQSTSEGASTPHTPVSQMQAFTSAQQEHAKCQRELQHKQQKLPKLQRQLEQAQSNLDNLLDEIAQQEIAVEVAFQASQKLDTPWQLRLSRSLSTLCWLRFQTISRSNLHLLHGSLKPMRGAMRH